MSRNILFSSDTHFFHENAIKHSGRPYLNIEEMNSKLVENWNSVVKPDDVVYHLGDVTWRQGGQTRGILEQLNGEIHLIKGNHDKSVVKETRFASVQDYKVLKEAGQFIVMSHFPMEAWDRSHHGSIHLHGHSHGNLNSFGRLRFDVGVDPNGYFPVSLEEVLSWVPGRKEQQVKYWEMKKDFDQRLKDEECADG